MPSSEGARLLFPSTRSSIHSMYRCSTSSRLGGDDPRRPARRSNGPRFPPPLPRRHLSFPAGDAPAEPRRTPRLRLRRRRHVRSRSPGPGRCRDRSRSGANRARPASPFPPPGPSPSRTCEGSAAPTVPDCRPALEAEEPRVKTSAADNRDPPAAVPLRPPLDVPVRAGHDPHVDGLDPVVTDPPDLSFLQHPEQLREVRQCVRPRCTPSSTPPALIARRLS